MKQSVTLVTVPGNPAKSNVKSGRVQNLALYVLPCSFLASVLVQSASGAVITATNDTFLDQTAPNTVRNGTGILMKGQTSNQRVGLIEFVLPDVEVTEATINLHHFRSWAAGETWTMAVRGKQGSFDETAVTWNNNGGILGTSELLGTLLMPGGNVGQDVVPAQWRDVDITNFFNANKGTTVTFILRNTDNHANKGGTIEDREGSRTGSAANGPYIAFVEVPEPAAALLLIAALPMLRRRAKRGGNPSSGQRPAAG